MRKDGERWECEDIKMTGGAGEVFTCVLAGTCLVVVVVVVGRGRSCSSLSEEHLVTTSRTVKHQDHWDLQEQ